MTQLTSTSWIIITITLSDKLFVLHCVVTVVTIPGVLDTIVDTYYSVYVLREMMMMMITK
jgi:hypothetical protein